MGRKPRRESESGYYHVIIRGNNKHWLFREDEDFKKFEELWEKYLKRYGVLLFHYCLMSNRVHMLVQSEPASSLGRMMHGIQRSYHHYYRRKYTFFGHLFQGRYRSLPIEQESYLLECGRYIERNPVRAGLIGDPSEWRYSSYQMYVEGKEKPFVRCDPAYLGLASTDENRRKIYREYTEQTRAYEELVEKQLVGSK
ncbi:MAG TPA: transposase [Candidatus Omnitrophota bacterium]|nr:transposase [Candidatus Omnitrophota bacterium]